MLFKMYGEDAMEMMEMDADRQAYEDQAEYNATRPDRFVVPSKPMVAVDLDSIPF